MSERLYVWACACRQWAEDGATRGEPNDRCLTCNQQIEQIEVVRLADLQALEGEHERLKHEYEQVADRGDFLIYRAEYDALKKAKQQLRELQEAVRDLLMFENVSGQMRPIEFLDALVNGHITRESVLGRLSATLDRIDNEGTE